MNFQTGVLDKARLVSNVLMLVLLAGNIYFSIQYQALINLQEKTATATEAKGADRIQIARFLKFYVDTVLNTKGAISFEDRVKLENDLRQIHDPELTTLWEAFVNSKGEVEAQTSAVKLMSTMTSKML